MKSGAGRYLGNSRCWSYPVVAGCMVLRLTALVLIIAELRVRWSQKEFL